MSPPTFGLFVSSPYITGLYVSTPNNGGLSVCAPHIVGLSISATHTVSPSAPAPGVILPLQSVPTPPTLTLSSSSCPVITHQAAGLAAPSTWFFLLGSNFFHSRERGNKRPRPSKSVIFLIFFSHNLHAIPSVNVLVMACRDNAAMNPLTEM